METPDLRGHLSSRVTFCHFILTLMKSPAHAQSSSYHVSTESSCRGHTAADVSGPPGVNAVALLSAFQDFVCFLSLHPPASTQTQACQCHRHRNTFLSFFLYFEREREDEHEQGRGRKRRRAKISSRLCTDGADMGLRPTN